MSRRTMLGALVPVLLLAAVAWWGFSSPSASAPNPEAPPPPRTTASVPLSPASPAAVPASTPDPDVKPRPWGEVDLQTLREALPDNRYWTHAVPTRDPAERARRAQEKADRNLRFGAIQAGQASHEEIDAFYDERVLISEDHLEFVEYLLNQHASDLPERDVGLLLVGRDMHLRRLEQLPDERARAHDRRDEQLARRAEWSPTREDAP